MEENILSLEYIDYEVSEELANDRLDKILSMVNSENLSRNQIQSLIEQNYVYVNGKKEKAVYLTQLFLFVTPERLELSTQ